MHGRKTDIEKTKEQIKLELMGSLDDKKTDYTSQDVIAAVKKVTGEDIVSGTEMVQDINISDLWPSVNFTLKYHFAGDWYGTSEYEKTQNFTAKKGETWYEWFGSGDTEKIKERATKIGLVSDNEAFVFQTMFSKSTGEYSTNTSSFSFYFRLNQNIESASNVIKDNCTYKIDLYPTANW